MGIRKSVSNIYYKKIKKYLTSHKHSKIIMQIKEKGGRKNGAGRRTSKIKKRKAGGNVLSTSKKGIRIRQKNQHLEKRRAIKEEDFK